MKQRRMNPMETETATEPVQSEVEQTETPATEQETATAPEVKAFDPATIPKEIQEYFGKQKTEYEQKFADYEKHQKAAQEWEGVRNDPRFQQFAQSLNAPAQPKPLEITDEQFTAALSDKGQFIALVNQAARQLLDQQVRPQLEQTQQHFLLQSKINEINEVSHKYPDFKELDKRGFIEPLVRKYPNLSFEEIYKMAKFETFDEEADKRARGIIEKKKGAGVERGHNAPGAKTSRVSAKNREEAMEMVMEAVKAGREVPEFDSIGDE